MRQQISVGIFQANWPLQVHTLNLARALASAGLTVHLFLYNANDGMVELDALPGIRIHRIPETDAQESPLLSVLPRRTAKNGYSASPSTSREPQEEKSFKSFVPSQFKDALGRTILRATWNRKLRDWHRWSHGAMVQPVLDRLAGERLSIVFGVEPYSFVWADAVGRQFQARSIYYSLELKNEKWLGVNARMLLLFRFLRDEALHRCSGLIIQDHDRLGEFRKLTNWKGERVFSVPVSLFGPPTTEPSRFLHGQLNISENKRIILCFGWINGHRGSAYLVEAAKSFPDDCVLVFHSGLSWCNDATLIEKATRESKGKVLFSLNRLDSSELELMASSATVGLCFYSARNEDERMTGRSSEKMARYTKAGLPVIAWNYPSYCGVFEQHPFGLTVNSYAGVGDALRQILCRYEEYRSHSFAAYERIYRAEPHYERLVEWMTEANPDSARPALLESR